jgi:Helicase associated domain
MVTSTKDLQWNAVHDRLVHYEKEFGHSDVLTSYNDGWTPHLGKWVSRHRDHTLESLCLSWTWTRAIQRDSWTSCFNRLSKFYEKYEHADVKQSCTDEECPHLGIWLHRQKDKYKANTLSQVKINKMESLGVTRRSKSEQTSNLELERRLDRLELEQEGRYSVSSDNSTSLFTVSNYVDYDRDSSKFDPIGARPAQDNAT